VAIRHLEIAFAKFQRAFAGRESALKNFRADFLREIGPEKFQEEFAQERRTKEFRRNRLAGGKQALKNFKGVWHPENRSLQFPRGVSPVGNRP
jgi:hypothetical protein